MNRPLRLAECSQPISWVYVGILRSVLQPILGCSPRICGMFATCSFSVCYIFALQKYGFCRAKVWFLVCKNGVFTLQKYGFCFLNVVLLQYVLSVLAIRSPRCCNPFATLWQSVSSAFAPVCHAFAEYSPRFGNP